MTQAQINPNSPTDHSSFLFQGASSLLLEGPKLKQGWRTWGQQELVSTSCARHTYQLSLSLSLSHTNYILPVYNNFLTCNILRTPEPPLRDWIRTCKYQQGYNDGYKLGGQKYSPFSNANGCVERLFLFIIFINIIYLRCYLLFIVIVVIL